MISRPICTKPIRPVPGPFVGLLPVGFLSPVACTDMKHGARAILPLEVATRFCSCRAPSLPPSAVDQKNHPPTLQLLDPSAATTSVDPPAPVGALGPLQAVAPPAAGAEPSEATDLAPRASAASPRRSPRIQQLYDGICIDPIERASKRKASVSPAGREGSRRRSLGRKKGKALKAASIVELPLQDTPRPLTRGKAKLLARCRGLNFEAVCADASASSSAASGGAPDSSESTGSAHE